MASHEMVLRPQTFDQLTLFAQMAAKSSMVPKDYIGKPENIMLAVQMGSELGLAPMQAIQNIAVINGRPAVWGDAMLALVKVHPEFEDIQETIEGSGDQRVAVCRVKRRGQIPVVTRFSIDHAKQVGLLGKPGPWQQYLERMLQMRARGFALRDAFPDALKGLISAEEAYDSPRPAPSSAISDAKAATVSPSEAHPTPSEAHPTPSEAHPTPSIDDDGRRLEGAIRTALANCADLADVEKVVSRWKVTLTRQIVSDDLKSRIERMIEYARETRAATQPGDLG